EPRQTALATVFVARGSDAAAKDRADFLVLLTEPLAVPVNHRIRSPLLFPFQQPPSNFDILSATFSNAHENHTRLLEESNCGPSAGPSTLSPPGSFRRPTGSLLDDFWLLFGLPQHRLSSWLGFPRAESPHVVLLAPPLVSDDLLYRHGCPAGCREPGL